MPTAQARGDAGWPLYFAASDIVTDKIAIKKGQLFPWQDKQLIKGLGGAAGCPDSWQRPFGELPYVVTVDAKSINLAESIRGRNLTLDAAKKLVQQPEA
jgi:hypothetical protein